MEKIADWLPRYTALATALRMNPARTISAAQLSRRGRQLGLWPSLFFFVALVGQLLRLAALTGRPVILDASLLQAWYHRDSDADRAGRHRGALWVPPT